MARPKGSKNKASMGLPLPRRMKVLQKIILDETQKTCDRLAAIKNMTDMLSDKVKETKEGLAETVLSFETKINTENTEKTIEKTIENNDTIKNILPSNEASSAITSVICPSQTIATEQLINNNGIELEFNIDESINLLEEENDQN